MRALKRQVATRRGRPTNEDARRKLEKVLAVARDEFCNRGYRSVTMRDVAAKARVSTRTLYNRYTDKLSLLGACLDFESLDFPTPQPISDDEAPAAVLERYAAALVRALSTDSSVRLTVLVTREGSEFPELLRAAEAHEDRVLIQPLAAYLQRLGLETAGSTERTKLFLAMALAQWQRAGSYLRPPPREGDILQHASIAVRTFLRGTPVFDNPQARKGRPAARPSVVRELPAQ